MALTRIGSIGINTDITLGGISTFSADGVDITGIVTATSFVGSGSGLTGVASTDDIRTNTNATFLQNINVSGTVTATSYAGSGANLTNLPAANLTGTAAAINGSNITNLTAANLTGALPAISGANLTGIAVGISTEAASISGITTYLDLTKDDHELVVTGTNTISVIGGPQGTSHSLRIQNSGIATVTLDSTYFKFPSGAAPALPTTSGAISMISFTVHKAGAVGVNTILLAGASVSFS
tara:strand:+ start:1195 stop:1911 length:717 start_codon:yes stop_codon:yes gene_type:complete